MIKDITDCDRAVKRVLEGAVIDKKRVPVVFIEPEREVVLKEVPTIAFYRTGTMPDYTRWESFHYFYSDIRQIPGTDGKYQASYRNPPEPYSIFYAIRVYFESRRDGAILTNHIYRMFNRNAFIEINGVKYDFSFVNYTNPDVRYRDFGNHKEVKEREFVEQYLFRLDIEFDFGEKLPVPLSEELDIDVQDKDSKEEFK